MIVLDSYAVLALLKGEAGARTVRAGALRARHYHRRDRAVSLADCVAALAPVRGRVARTAYWCRSSRV